MRRSIVSLMVLIVTLAFALPSAMAPVAAQAPTSTPESEEAVTGAIGETISYISESGSEIATLTVLQMVRPWDEFDEFYDPQTGTEYVAFEIEVTHLGRRGELVLRGFDFRLQDVDGFLLSQAWTNSAEGADLVPSEDDVAIASGDTATIVVVFQVIEGIDLSNLYWLPDYDRMITLADLTGI